MLVGETMNVLVVTVALCIGRRLVVVGAVRGHGGGDRCGGRRRCVPLSLLLLVLVLEMLVAVICHYR